MKQQSATATGTTGFEAFEQGSVRGFLHRASGDPRGGLVLTHGAGGDCTAPLLVAIAKAFQAKGVGVLRCDLPFRQNGSGPPSPARAAADRAGLREAVAAMRGVTPGPTYLGGQSYGGRQASMLAAEDPDVAAALLLLSYPLHPPGKPAQLRTAHFPKLRTRCVFVHGTNDPFATEEELRTALALIPAEKRTISIEDAGHDLKRGRIEVAPIVAALLE